MEPGFPHKVAIVGLGLMGGSLALAIKQFVPGVEVLGVDFPEVLESARERGAIDAGHPPAGIAQSVRDAGLVFLATPIRTILALIEKVASHMREGAVLTDLGSTKVNICRAAREHVPEEVYFIGGHPLTGCEGRGIENADPFLFQNALYVLTPVNGPDTVTEALAGFLERLGAIVVVLDPETHDRIAAYVSHLPQLVAVALVNLVGKEEGYLGFAAGGFRDLTRIASSPYGIWEDILQTNAPRIKEALEAFLEELSRLEERIEVGPREEFERAQALRASLPRAAKGFLGVFPRIRVILPDRPGALAALTGALAREGINIKDLELLRVREEIGGTFQIYLGSGEDAKRAVTILRGIGYQARVVD